MSEAFKELLGNIHIDHGKEWTTYMLSRNDSTFDYSLHSQSLITSNFHQQIFKLIYGAN